MDNAADLAAMPMRGLSNATAIADTVPPTLGGVELDALWAQMVGETRCCDDPIMCRLMRSGIHDHAGFAVALAALMGRKLADSVVPAGALAEMAAAAYAENAGIVDAAASDLVAIRERDPAAPDLVTPFLFFKGYQALQVHRVAHHLWRLGRRHLAQHLQSRMSERFGMDIHPAAAIGRRVLVDHGTGIVIGETAVVEDDVSILQGVTLGGTGKNGGDRHPKIRRGVLIGAGATVLGNIEIGEGAKVGAGSMVLEAVQPYTTVVGNPARIVGRKHSNLPALTMDQMLPPLDYVI